MPEVIALTKPAVINVHAAAVEVLAVNDLEHDQPGGLAIGKALLMAALAVADRPFAGHGQLRM
jgi:hypothetical protein